jgi:hypothetical protein
VGHAHFDHIAGAELIARNTGARIIGSHESCRVMREQDVAANQLLPSQGGERHRLAADVTVRVFPSLHSCTWTTGSLSAMEASTGDLGLCEDERAGVAARQGLGSTIGRRAETGDSAALLRPTATAVGSGQTGDPCCLIETRRFDLLAGHLAVDRRAAEPGPTWRPGGGRVGTNRSRAPLPISSDRSGTAAATDDRAGPPRQLDAPVTPEVARTFRPSDRAGRVFAGGKLLEPGYMDGTLLSLKSAVRTYRLGPGR